MGQKVHPIGLRLGIVEDWRSRWYAAKGAFGPSLVQDFRIRQYIKQRYGFAGIARVDIERIRGKVRVILHCARPGVIIGRRGQEVIQLSSDLAEIAGTEVDVDIKEINRPELEAQLVAESIAEQVEKRAPYRRTMKRCAELTRQAGAKGIKIKIAGRLAGAEIARSERLVVGQIPLHTLKVRIDYGYAVAKTIYGTIGVKVWINRGTAEEQKETQDGSHA